MLHLSWFKWPDILIDYGRELYIPWQINQGKILYADIHHLYGPLAHYLNAFLFKIFGTGLSTLAYFNIVLIIILTAIIYHVFESSCGKVTATTAALCFLVIFAFSQYDEVGNYNFVCPYSHELTYGIILFFIMLGLFKRYLTRSKTLYTGVIGLILGLIFLTKVEVFTAAIMSMACGLLIFFRRFKPAGLHKHILFLVFFFGIPLFAFFLFFSLHMPAGKAFHAIVAPYENILVSKLVTNIFYQRISGFDNPSAHLAIMFKQFAYQTLFFIVVFAISWLAARIAHRQLRLIFATTAFFLFVVLIMTEVIAVDWYLLAKPFPLFLAGLTVYLAFRLFSKDQDRDYILKHLPIFSLSVFSFILLFKMILNVHLLHYGFALAMPATLVMIALLTYYFPALTDDFKGNGKVSFAFTGLIIFFTLIIYGNLSKIIYESKTYPVAKEPDRFFTFNTKISNKGLVINQAVDYINFCWLKRDTFIVFPEGIMLNYLTRRNNPCRYFEFTPNLVEALGEDHILRQVSLSKPSFVILTEKDTSEHGARYFGQDYAMNIYSWIYQNYDKLVQFGNEPLSGQGFGILILAKKT